MLRNEYSIRLRFGQHSFLSIRGLDSFLVSSKYSYNKFCQFECVLTYNRNYFIKAVISCVLSAARVTTLF